MRRFVTTNNAYVAALEERDRLLGVTDGLRRSVELQMIRDISFDPHSGILSFVQTNPHDLPLPCAVEVHAADRPYFTPIGHNDMAVVEYRTAGSEGLESYLVTLRQNIGDHAWAGGTIIKLRQPERLREVIVRQARLVDLGSMLAAISHEVKQPLFTIAMAAESVQIILRKLEGAERQHIERCVKRIGVQVERAREIIHRISRYGRGAAAAPDVSDPAAALDMSCSFLQPLLEDRDIAVTLDLTGAPMQVGVPQIALEQVFVNAIQNAVDAIQSAREGGRAAGGLALYARPDGDGVRCGVRDDGIGLGESVGALAFDPFFTTKSADKGSGLGLFISRQIITDAGGTIRLTANPGAGATLDVWLPAIGARGEDRVAEGGKFAAVRAG